MHEVLVERAVEEAVAAWPRTLDDATGPEKRCVLCPVYSGLLWRDDLPHFAVHPLLTGIEEVVVQVTLRQAFDEIPRLAAMNVRIDGGVVTFGILHFATAELLPVPARRFLEFERASMQDRYFAVRRIALDALWRRRVTIDTAVNLHVEPVVKSLAADLLRDVDPPSGA